MLRTQTRFRWRNDDGGETSASWLAAENVDAVADRDTNVRLRCQIKATGDPPPTAYTLRYRKVGDATWLPVPSRKLPDLTTSPPQSASICYTSPNPTDPRYADIVTYYAHPGGMVVAGRDNYDFQAFKDVSAGGGCVLIYLDALIDLTYGTYHGLLHGASVYGPAVPRWPGDWVVNAAGFGSGPVHLQDFRVGGILQSKLEPVLEQMAADNPHMGGFFMDDLGTRSYFPDLSWAPRVGVGAEFPLADKQAYRAGAIELCRTARRVADKYGLFVMVNGTWNAYNNPAVTLEDLGGGYPDATRFGSSLADGGFVEHHVEEELPFWHAYASDPQWASESATCAGTAFHWAAAADDATRDVYIADGSFAFVATQNDYGTPPVPYATLHPTGLPDHVGTPKPVVISISPNIRNGGGGTTRQLTVPT